MSRVFIFYKIFNPLSLVKLPCPGGGVKEGLVDSPDGAGPWWSRRAHLNDTLSRSTTLRLWRSLLRAQLHLTKTQSYLCWCLPPRAHPSRASAEISERHVQRWSSPPAAAARKVTAMRTGTTFALRRKVECSPELGRTNHLCANYFLQ